jgi:hypothetical protein
MLRVPRHLRLELEVQPRLADPRLRHRRDDLPAPRLCLIGGMLKRIHLALTSDELGQATPGRALQPRPQRPQPGHLVNVDLLADAFDSGGTEWLKDEIALTQLAGILTNRD